MDIRELIKAAANVMFTLNVSDLRNVIQDIVKEERAQTKKEIESHQEEATMTRKEVAKYLNVTLSTLCRWDKVNYLVPKRIGHKRVLYLKSEVEALLKKKD